MGVLDGYDRGCTFLLSEHERERTEHTLPASEFVPHAVTCKGVL